MDSGSSSTATQILKCKFLPAESYFKFLIESGFILGLFGRNITEQQNSIKDTTDAVQHY